MSSSAETVGLIPIKLLVEGEPHAELANIGDSVNDEANFWRRWKKLFIQKGPVGPDKKLFPREAMEGLQGFGFGSLVKQRDILRKAWRGDKDADILLRTVFTEAASAKVRLDENGVFQLEIAEFAPVIGGLFIRDQIAGKLGICENPDCKQPYFIKARSTQVLCQLPFCVQWKQRKFKLDWWNSTGSKQRAKGKKRKR